MLLVMTFEVGLVIVTPLGLGIGNLIFSFCDFKELPKNVIWTAKHGRYEPNPDPCCHKTIAGSETEMIDMREGKRKREEQAK